MVLPRLIFAGDSTGVETEIKTNIEQPLSVGIQKKRSPVVKYNKNAMVAALIPALMLGKVDACDTTAYVSSSNLIYRDSGMTELYSGVFLMSTGMNVCLRYADDTVDQLTVISTWLEEVYTPMYKTSNFDMKVETKWNCMGSGYCWEGYCQKNSMHPDWRGTDMNGTITTYGCFQNAGYCTHCSYNKQCVYYRNVLKPKGSIYTVSKLTN